MEQENKAVKKVKTNGDGAKPQARKKTAPRKNKGVKTQPDRDIDEVDTGDSTIRRYRFQCGYGAILCLSLIKGDSELSCIYCEQQEDILLKYQDGSFCGVQVKTRQDGLEPFKATDAKIVASIQKFVQLEIDYPGQFSRFVLAANYGFWRVYKTKDNLVYSLNHAKKLIKEGSPFCDDLLVRDLVSELRKVEGATDVIIARVISLIELQSNLPTLDDIEMRLVSHLKEMEEYKFLPITSLLELANNLIERVERASGLAYEPRYKDYAAIMRYPDEAGARAIIEGKLIEAETILSIIEPFKNPDVLLRSGMSAKPQNGRSSTKLEKKLRRGGVSDNNIDLLKVQMNSAEAYGIETVAKWGEPTAIDRWNHVRLIVQSQCQEAYDDKEVGGGFFGMAMLKDVRSRLKSTHSLESNLFGYRYEHWLGVAAVLTQECKVWWSEPFLLEED